MRVIKPIVILLTISISILYWKVNTLIGPISTPPELPLNEWWGDEASPKDWDAYVANTSKVTNNRIMFPAETIENLLELLNHTSYRPFPKQLEGVAFQYGFNPERLEEIVDYWRDDYLPRWLEREVFLWQFNQFTTIIQGLRLHFLHLMVHEDHKKNRGFYPILLLHGWPSSIREFYSLIPKLHILNDDESNEYIFNVVAPSLPGFAWSQGTSRQGLGAAQIAVILRNLMLRLGYTKFFIHAGDFGSKIGSNMATLFPENVIGYHSINCLNMSPKSLIKGAISGLLPAVFVPKRAKLFFQSPIEKWTFLLQESGYLHIQIAKPDTIGHALTKNPIGLAAYILEKYSTWTNPDYRNRPDGGFAKRFKLDTLIDTVMIYYLTNSITTSQRLYAESFSSQQLALQLDRVPTKVPTGCARFRYDLVHQLDFQLTEKYPNLIHSSFHDKGGHFAALEVPSLVFEDIIAFVKKVDKFNNVKR